MVGFVLGFYRLGNKHFLGVGNGFSKKNKGNGCDEVVCPNISLYPLFRIFFNHRDHYGLLNKTSALPNHFLTNGSLSFVKEDP